MKKFLVLFPLILISFTGLFAEEVSARDECEATHCEEDFQRNLITTDVCLSFRSGVAPSLDFSITYDYMKTKHFGIGMGARMANTLLSLRNEDYLSTIGLFGDLRFFKFDFAVGLMMSFFPEFQNFPIIRILYRSDRIDLDGAKAGLFFGFDYPLWILGFNLQFPY